MAIKPAKDSFVYTKNKKYAGTVTSAMWSPSAKASIALASLEAPLGKPGEELRGRNLLPAGIEMEPRNGTLPRR